jgi:cupin fold WbuC family metalloprotein
MAVPAPKEDHRIMPGSTIERLSPQATQSTHPRLLLIDQALVDAKARDAAHSPRRREIHRLHLGDDARLQRMLNAVQPGSYVRPHRHLDPPKDEAIVILQGAIGHVTFDDQGHPLRQELAILDARRGAFALDVRAGLWHTFFALQPDTVVFEAKPGPYDATTDKGFAPWAPAEGTADAAVYLERLEAWFRRVMAAPTP